jgi:hypothetical protein
MAGIELLYGLMFWEIWYAEIGFDTKVCILWRRLFLEKPINVQLFKEFAAFMGSAGSVPYSQQPATDSILEIS